MARPDEDLLLFLMFAGGALMLARAADPDWGAERWYWPVPDLITADGTRYPAVVTHEFEGLAHPGVDVMYQRKKPEDMPAYPPNGKAKDGITTVATAKFFAPVDTPILAARDAKVWSVLPSTNGNGIFVVLDHGPPWATMYGHLSSSTLPIMTPEQAKQNPRTVKAGDVIGIMGAGLNKDPAKGLVDGQHLRHLHFEAWYKGAGPSAAVDTTRVIGTWGRSTWQTKL